jgi:hypothetical protein
VRLGTDDRQWQACRARWTGSGPCASSYASGGGLTDGARPTPAPRRLGAPLVGSVCGVNTRVVANVTTRGKYLLPLALLTQHPAHVPIA